MTASSAPFGFIPVNEAIGYGTRGETAYPGGITSAYNTDIYKYQPVKLTTSGVLNPAPTSADIIGVFAGCEYTDATGRRKVSNYWPANTVATDVIAYVWDHPDTIYEVQADGALAQTAVGDQADCTNGSNQQGTLGLSAATLSSTLGGAGVQKMFRVVGISNRVDNEWGDAYTVVKVKIAQHQYVASKVAI
jgi:hypothetical protein